MGVAPGGLDTALLQVLDHRRDGLGVVPWRDRREQLPSETVGHHHLVPKPVDKGTTPEPRTHPGGAAGQHTQAMTVIEKSRGEPAADVAGGAGYEDCCGVIHAGGETAPTKPGAARRSQGVSPFIDGQSRHGLGCKQDWWSGTIRFSRNRWPPSAIRRVGCRPEPPVRQGVAVASAK